VKWQEEVQLSTGETIVIDRDVRHEGGGAAWPHGQGTIPREFLIRFRYPHTTGPLIERRSTKLTPATYAELPLVLDIAADKSWYIYTHFWEKGCRVYLKYQLVEGIWKEVALAEDIEVHPSNLYLEAGWNGIQGLVRLDEKNRVLSWLYYTPDFKQVGPKRKVCGY
jgi:hypothetical protein